MLTENEGCGGRVLSIEKLGVAYALAARYPDLLHTGTAFAMAKCKFERAWQKANFVSHLSCCRINVLHFCRDAQMKLLP